MSKSLAVAFLILVSCMARGQTTIAIPDAGWRLFLDSNAVWANDRLYLPDEVRLAELPVNPPTGGWGLLDGAGTPVTLPTTVEEHFWGARGFRPYREEYAYEAQDSAVQNGNYLGVSWWVRDIDVPASFAGRTAFLTIRGARLRAEVYWNQRLVGYDIITETSFTCDVTEAITPGARNRCAIRITNPGGRLDWVDTQLLEWGSTTLHKSHGFGGLDRGLVLSAHDPVYVTDCWVLNTAEKGKIIVNTTAENRTGREVRGKLQLEVIDPEQRGRLLTLHEEEVMIAADRPSQVRTELTVPGAKTWSLASPRLYILRAVLATPSGSGGTSWSDAFSRTFGFRWFTADGIGKDAELRLNGERTRIVSAISWGFWGKNGLWPTPELAEREVRVAKLLGMNCIQFHRNIGKAEVFDAQDRLGLLRYMEPGGGQTALGDRFSLYAPSPRGPVDVSGTAGDPQTFAEKYMEEKIVRMVRDHRSHPSLIMYAIQNEIHPDLANPRVFRILRRVHEEDPSRIVVLKSGFPSGSPSNQAWMRPYSDSVLHDAGNGYSGWWDDHTVGGPGVWRDEMYRGPHEYTHRSTNDSEVVMWGEMLGAAVADNHALMVRQLEAEGGKSYDILEHRAALAGYNRFLDKWSFRSAFPTTDALFVSIGNKSYDFWGRVIETARLAEANDYFVISGWESTAIENHSGLVDNLRGFKGDPRLIRSRLAPLRPVVKPHALVAAAGEELAYDLYLLNETGHPHGKRLRVSITDPGGMRRSLGSFAVPPFTRGRFVYPVAASLKTPRLQREGQYQFRLVLEGAQKATAEEPVLVVRVDTSRVPPVRAGVVSIHPDLQADRELIPGVHLEPWQQGKTYDLIIAANRFVVPPATGVDDGRDIKGTEDDELYRTIHYGVPENFDYIFAGLPGGQSRVTLRFAELFQNAEGVRVFDIAINGDTVLHDFDVFKAAGGKDVAFDTVQTVDAPLGIVRITVPRTKAGSARICAIKIELGDSVVAVNCGGGTYRDRAGLLWQPYAPSLNMNPQVLQTLHAGTPLLVLAEGESATQRYGEFLDQQGAIHYLGHLGEARAPWMGSWYFVREHPLYAGLPVNTAMGSFYQVPVSNTDGLLVDGKGVDVCAGYSRDHDRTIGAASMTAPLGKGRVVFHAIPGLIATLGGMPSGGMHPVVARRLLLNSIAYLTQKGAGR